MSSEALIGVIWSPDLHYGGGVGYALVITSDRVVGSRKPALFHAFEIYLGPRIKHPTTDADRAKAQKVADDLISNKEFEFTKDSIVRISYKRPGLYSRGHIVFQTKTQQIQVDISFLQGGVQAEKTAGLIVASLNILAPDRFYNEETGVLIREELLEKVAEKQQEKKHWL
jgi:hypothetical protein